MTDTIVKCRKCNLYKTQSPLLDQDTKADIMLIGISSKIKKYEDEIPLDPRTRSGKLVEQMAAAAQRYGWRLYRTNLVKCPPTGEDGRLRYPDETEIAECFDHIQKEIEAVDPKLIFLLGNMVLKTVRKRWRLTPETDGNSGFSIYQYGGRMFVASRHPSYIQRSAQRTKDYLYDYGRLLASVKGRM